MTNAAKAELPVNKYKISYTIIGDNNYAQGAYGVDVVDAIESFKTGFVKTDNLLINAIEFHSVTNLKRA